MLLMLEDDAVRLERFATVLHEIDPAVSLCTWRNAYRMVDEAGPLLPSAIAISLDHDLDPEPGGADPGDGYQVIQWLVGQAVILPVVIHTSNSPRAQWMVGACELAGWRHYRVAPLGEDWIETDWRLVIRRLLKKQRP